MIQEKDYPAMQGGPMLAVLLLALAADVGLFVLGFWVGLWLIIAAAVLFPIILALFAGLFAVPPNEARALQLFGRYVGTARTPGLRYANPLYSKQRVSVRVRNFETQRSNDTDGNPIETAAVVVWRVVDTAVAIFEWTTTSTSCTCRASRRCGTWRRTTPTTRSSRGRCRCAGTRRRSPRG